MIAASKCKNSELPEAMVAEEVWRASKAHLGGHALHSGDIRAALQKRDAAWRCAQVGPAEVSGVEIIPADLPGLFKHNPNPGESLMRKVMAAVQEFERDVVVARLAHGLQERRAQMRKQLVSSTSSGSGGPGGSGVSGGGRVRTTQGGDAKVNGRLSVIEHIAKHGSKGKVLKALRAIRVRTLSKKVSWRLAERFLNVQHVARSYAFALAAAKCPPLKYVACHCDRTATDEVNKVLTSSAPRLRGGRSGMTVAVETVRRMFKTSL